MKIDSRGIKRFIKYSSVGFGTFLFDLLLLYILVSFLEWNYLFSSGLAFLVAVSINYIISRKLVFRKTKKGFSSGYINFIAIALVGLGITLLGMALLVEILGLYYIAARCLVAGLVGTVNYLSNLFLNFKVAGVHN